MKTLSIFFALFFSINISAQLTLPSIFADNMVLQRDAKIPVWGKAVPEAKVTVSFRGQKKITTSDKEGNWKVYLSPVSTDSNPQENPPAAFKKGGLNPPESPFITHPGLRPPLPDASTGTFCSRGEFWEQEGGLTIESEGSEIIFTNVLVGEVWLCSGQSNMKFELKHALGAKKFIAEAKESGIRFYQADRYNFKPYECDNCSGEWKVCTTNNVRNLTAVGYLFGMEIHKKIGVPIGLIEVDFGGSIVESWMSAAVLQKWDYFKKDLAKLAKYKNAKSFDFLKKKETKKWFDKLKKIDPGFKNNWMNPNINASDWMKIKSPRAQKIECLKGHNGIVWFRKKIFIPKKFKGKNIVISFERIVGYELTWLNGKMIDKTYEMSSGRWHRRYGIPATEFKIGTNTIVICDFANKDRGTPGEPLLTLSIYQKDDPSKEIKYSSDWLCKKGYDNTDYPERPYSFKLGNNILAIHYNSRIYPIIPYAIRGVLWYQGESNQHNPEEYAELFSTMIKSWRERWGEGKFPFYFVQIAPFDYGKKRNSAFLREAQFKTLALTTNTGMAVIMDIGENHNIHPLRKKEVGHRLALWALAKDYGYTNLVYSGPLYKSYKIEWDKIIISFDYDKGLKTKDRKSLSCFEIAGNDKKFYPAKAKIINDKIVVSSDKVKNPVAVRFAFSNTAKPNLCNGVGLPASSFRTDEWE